MTRMVLADLLLAQELLRDDDPHAVDERELASCLPSLPTVWRLASDAGGEGSIPSWTASAKAMSATSAWDVLVRARLWLVLALPLGG